MSNHDFATLCNNQIEKLGKRLTSLQKAYIKEYKLALSVINNEATNEHYMEIIAEVENHLNDASNRCEALFTEHMRRVQGALGQYL